MVWDLLVLVGKHVQLWEKLWPKYVKMLLPTLLEMKHLSFIDIRWSRWVHTLILASSRRRFVCMKRTDSGGQRLRGWYQVFVHIRFCSCIFLSCLLKKLLHLVTHCWNPLKILVTLDLLIDLQCHYLQGIPSSLNHIHVNSQILLWLGLG